MKRISHILVIFAFIVLIIPTNVLAEQLTYGQILDDLAKAQKELEKNNQSVGNAQGQVQKDNETIKNLKSEIEKMKNENTELQQEIADSYVEIDNKKEQTKDLIAYLQVSQGENVYLDYVFGGETITDLVYRLSIVEQITEYNETMIKELDELITRNEKRKVELAENEQKTEQKIENLKSEVAKLNNTVTQLSSLTPSLKDEVKAKQDLVNYYKSQGCSNRSDVIGVDCARTASSGIFLRPIKTGYITSFINYRYICTPKKDCYSSFHKGTDMGSPLGKNTPIYSIGTGVITSKWTDGDGAICINVQYKDAKGTYYTAIYAHLSRYADGLYVGKTVTSDTILGYMGDTGNVTGVHLHLEVYPCRLYIDSNCRTWSAYSQYAENLFKKGYKGTESVIDFPSRVSQTWYSR